MEETSEFLKGSRELSLPLTQEDLLGLLCTTVTPNFNFRTALSIWSDFKRNDFVSQSKNFCLCFPFILFKPSSCVGLLPIGTARETQMHWP